MSSAVSFSSKNNVFQGNRGSFKNVYDIPYYKPLKPYLLFLGLDPYQETVISKIVAGYMMYNALYLVILGIIGIIVSISNNDMDSVYEILPHLSASMISTVKIFNVHLNRKTFKKLLELVVEEWEILPEDELYPLEKLTKRASKVTHIYRTCLLSAMMVFLFLPLLPCILDVFLPLNETRPRQQLLQVNYLFFDAEEHYFPVYFQLSWSAIIVVTIIVTVDSLYITIIHHASGMFAICGYQIQKAAEMANADGTIFTNTEFIRFKRCFITHNKAIQFYEILKDASTNSYLCQIGVGMIGISVTAVEFVTSLDRPREAIRAVVFLTAKQFHLFLLSLPGQVLLDHCSELAINIYYSKWYKTPVKIQKMIQIMKIRATKPCELTAGGLYVLGIENFGITLKTCMSYITMLLSLKK